MSEAIEASGPPQEAPPAGPVMRFLSWAGDRLNPILVKETRQSLKSRQFTLWFVLLLLACWVATIGAIAIIGPSIYYVSAGSLMLYVYYVILALPLAVVVPFSAYRSLSSEHEENTRDLLEVSTLTPRQVINGKLGSAGLQVTIYLSALAPCIAFTYLLRGVNLATIALLLLYAVFAAMGMSMIGLMLAAVTRKKYSQVVMSVALAGILFGVFSGLLTAAAGVLALDPSEFRSEWFWWLHLGILSLYVTTFAVFYAATVSLTTFTSANRSTPVRIALFAQQTVFVAWVAGLLHSGMPGEGLFGSFAVAAVYWFLAGAIMTSEDPTLSHRVRRSLPQSWLGRAVGSWFSPGGGSGYVFATANLLTLALLSIGYAIQQGGGGNPQIAKAVGLLTAYVVLYLGLGRFIILGLRRVTEVSSLGGFLLQVLCALAGSGLPFVVDTLSDRIRVADTAWINAMSPLWNTPRVLNAALSSDRELTLLFTVGALALAVALINLALASHEASQLRVSAPKRVREDDLDLNPPPEARPTNPWGDRPEPATDAMT
ncbi:ABC-2 family transporter protein [Planctomycetes bacterium MalM25]|nr:ABC-2 family transporter protein [Planctomycetes bacterium MalM25]